VGEEEGDEALAAADRLLSPAVAHLSPQLDLPLVSPPVVHGGLEGISTRPKSSRH